MLSEFQRGAAFGKIGAAQDSLAQINDMLYMWASVKNLNTKQLKAKDKLGKINQQLAKIKQEFQ